MSKRDPFNEWLVEWVDKHYPSAKFSRPDAREKAFKAMPFGHTPSMDKLIRQWFTKRFNDVLDGAGFAFPEGRQGKEVVRQDMLPWDEESLLLIDQLKLAKTDIGAVRERLVAWSAVNDPTMDIDRTMRLLMAAAGL